MAQGAGKNSALIVTNATGASVDISAYLTSITAPSIDAQTAEVSTLGDTYKEFIRTQTDPGTMSIEGIFEPLIGTLLYSLGTAAPTAIAYYPQGTAAGSPKYSGSALLTSYESGGGIDDAVTFSAEFQLTGVLTGGTA